MKVERKGNVYKRQSWLKEHDNLFIILSVVIVGYIVLAIAFAIWR